MRYFFNTLLFWLHIGLIGMFLTMGSVMPFWAVFCIVALHRAHVHVSRGCILSYVQTKLGGIPVNGNFLQFAAQRLFGFRITLQQANRVDYSFAFFTLLFSFTHQLYK